VVQHFRINKEYIGFAKDAEQNFNTEIFKFAKVIDRRLRAVYELGYLNGTPIEVQFFSRGTDPVRIIDRTFYKIDKVLDKRVKRGFREYVVSWRGYSQDFDSWVPASSVKNI